MSKNMIKEMIKEMISTLKSKRIYDRLDKIPIEIYSQKKHKFGNSIKDVKILLLCNPCNGFGDIVFCMKLRNYLQKWYHCDIKIASTKVDNFKTLGEKDKNLYLLKGGKTDQCRRFRNLHFVEKNKEIEAPKADLVFVAPLQMDYEINYSDIKALIPYSNFLNTYFFSEYNDYVDKKFDFPTGIGKDRMGMLFTDVDKKIKRFPSLKNKYVVIYIAKDVARSETCFNKFTEMVCEKYSHLTKFDIVVPDWIGKDEEVRNDYLDKKLLKKISKYFSNVDLVYRGGNGLEKINLLKNVDKKAKGNKSENLLTFRADILPLPYNTISTLFIKSERDILVTGDQSITDVLSCCWKNKLPMYQIVPWKRDFSKELAKYLPQKFLKYISESCGTAKAIDYHPDFAEFMKNWDFRILAKRKMDGIIAFTLDSKDKGVNTEVKKIFLTSKTKNAILEKLEELIS